MTAVGFDVPGAEFSFSYTTTLTDDDGVKKKGDKQNIILTVLGYYKICNTFLNMPAAGTLDRDILIGDFQEVFLDSVTNGNCEFELTYTILS